MQAKAHDAGDCGVYALVLRVREPGMRVRIGALGVLGFAPGYYCYVGSARRGLAARIARHLRRGGKRAHWHIDYLRRRTAVVGVATWRTRRRGAECELSRAVAALADGFVPRFGSSDCPCPSHLYYFSRDPRPDLTTSLRIEGTQRSCWHYRLWTTMAPPFEGPPTCSKGAASG